jgi:hypothetical protein
MDNELWIASFEQSLLSPKARDAELPDIRPALQYAVSSEYHNMAAILRIGRDNGKSQQRASVLDEQNLQSRGASGSALVIASGNFATEMTRDVAVTQRPTAKCSQTKS